MQTIKAMTNTFLSQLPKIALALVVFTIFYFLATTLRRWVMRLVATRRHKKNLSILLGRLTQAGIIVVGFFISSSIVFPSMNAQTLFQVLGVSGVAIGFAFRDILQNFLAGVLILLNEPFTIGDEIRFRDMQGEVEDILTRATFLRSQEGKRVVIPNSLLFTEPVSIITHADARSAGGMAQPPDAAAQSAPHAQTQTHHALPLHPQRQ